MLCRLGRCSDRTTIEQEMIIRALRLAYRIPECQSHERARGHGRSPAKADRDALRYVWCRLGHLVR